MGTEAGEGRAVDKRGKRKGSATPAEPPSLWGHRGDTVGLKSRTSLPPSAARCHHSGSAKQPPRLAPAPYSLAWAWVWELQWPLGS